MDFSTTESGGLSLLQKSKNTKIIEPPFVLVDRPTGGSIVIYQAQVDQKELLRFEIKARNQGVCPEGHPGAGKPAWLFIDEVIVK